MARAAPSFIMTWKGTLRQSPPACRAAAKSFVNGWVERMHELGNPAGVYGGACSSYISDWATIPNVPDDVWIAAWYTDYYDPDATVCGVSCLYPDSLWNDNQRLRQYAGDHNETWGNVTWNIDSNITHGRGAGTATHAGGSRPGPPGTHHAGRWSSGGEHRRPLSRSRPGLCWMGDCIGLHDGGVSWNDLSPGQGADPGSDLPGSGTRLAGQRSERCASPISRSGAPPMAGRAGRQHHLTAASETLLDCPGGFARFHQPTGRLAVVETGQQRQFQPRDAVPHHATAA